MSFTFLATTVAGAPLPGLSPTWSYYLDAFTGLPIGSPPAITELAAGVTGTYKTDVALAATGLILLGGVAEPQYVILSQYGTVVTFAAFDDVNVPRSSLSPVWTNYRRVSDGAAVTQPGIAALSGGLYKFTPADPTVHIEGVIDLDPTGLIPLAKRYLEYDSSLGVSGGGGGAIPSIVLLSPPTTERLGRREKVRFRATDAEGLRRVLPVVIFPGLGRASLVHSGDGFTEEWRDHSTRTAVLGGYEYEILYKGGVWPDAPTLVPFAFDLAGNEAP